MRSAGAAGLFSKVCGLLMAPGCDAASCHPVVMKGAFFDPWKIGNHYQGLMLY